VAHEVRNPLQAVRLTVQMLREQRRPEDRAGYDLILGEIDRLNLLTDELLVLAGKAELRAEPLDLPRELHETLRLMQFQLNQRDIRTELDLPPLPPVRMDRNRCRQLLLNLLLNAAEASPRGGLVRVECRLGDAAVVVRIADSGPGFPPEVLSGAAEEFFSTKTTGAGLGLSICRRIVQEAGGQLRLHNAAGGAVAEAVLPVDPDGRLV
jgi:signal transduction histidine kinase